MCDIKRVSAFVGAIVAVVVFFAALVLAEDCPVTVVKNDGTEVAGTLLDFGNRVYKVRLADGKVVEVPEGDVKKVLFGQSGKTPPVDPAVTAKVSALIEDLKNEDVEKGLLDPASCKARNELVKIGAPAVPLLMDNLKALSQAIKGILGFSTGEGMDQSRAFQGLNVAEALVQIGVPSVNPLAEVVRGTDLELAKIASFMLVCIGADAVPVLKVLLNSDDGEVKWLAAKALAMRGETAGYEEIESALRNGGDRQVEALRLVKDCIRNPHLANVLIPLLDDNRVLDKKLDWRVCDEVVEVLDTLSNDFGKVRITPSGSFITPVLMVLASSSRRKLSEEEREKRIGKYRDLTKVAEQGALRKDCCGNLKQISAAIAAHVGKNGSYPAGTGAAFFQALRSGLKGELAKDEIFICRLVGWRPGEKTRADRAGAGVCDFRGPKAQISKDTTAGTIIACDEPSNHNGEDVNVLFFDGRIETAAKGSELYKRAIAETVSLEVKGE
jgi:prepilin-type processing-associated H-X9-DG protein